MISESGSDIIEKCVINMGELPSKVHTCSNHYMVSSITLGVAFETSQVGLCVLLNRLKVIVELALNLLLYYITRPLVHATGGVVELVHNMGEDTVVGRDLP